MSMAEQRRTHSHEAPIPVPALARNGLADTHNFPLSTPKINGYRQNSLVSQPPLIQAKLAIGAPNDRYEQEADRMAEAVMRMPEPSVQRKPT